MLEVRCADLDAAVAEQRAFRIEMIIPADDPEMIELSLGDARVRLIRAASPRTADDAWHQGRAGMEYRDLRPDRLGGHRAAAPHVPIEDLGVASATGDAVSARIVRDDAAAVGWLSFPVGDGEVLDVTLP
jgi:hypothetical protein